MTINIKFITAAKPDVISLACLLIRTKFESAINVNIVILARIVVKTAQNTINICKQAMTFVQEIIIFTVNFYLMLISLYSYHKRNDCNTDGDLNESLPRRNIWFLTSSYWINFEHFWRSVVFGTCFFILDSCMKIPLPCDNGLFTFPQFKERSCWKKKW